MMDNPLFSPVFLKNILLKEGIYARKGRGQNFLIDRNVAGKILRAADIRSEDAVLEIGPGPGALTLELCRLAGKVIAVEWDKGLVRILKNLSSEIDNLEIVQNDFLQVDLKELTARLKKNASALTRLKVVANLPYFITGPLLVKLLESENEFDILVLMMQKEVGERIVSPPGSKNYGRLSVICRTHSDLEIVTPVSRNSFFPRPRVDSVVIKFRVENRRKSMITDPGLWKNLVRAAFSQRRKMLKNTLAANHSLGYSEEQIVRACLRVGIDPKMRAEQIPVEDYIRLAHMLHEIKLQE